MDATSAPSLQIWTPVLWNFIPIIQTSSPSKLLAKSTPILLTGLFAQCIDTPPTAFNRFWRSRLQPRFNAKHGLSNDHHPRSHTTKHMVSMVYRETTLYQEKVEHGWGSESTICNRFISLCEDIKVVNHYLSTRGWKKINEFSIMTYFLREWEA